ncbi:hypothetical protein Bhyg_13021 [Pseudolycoriella hygida]|uniref:Uncharacterized protein n=1 Tax=Pseudolycoriella hygida TaxID=35572 RepID=A0A9Q0MYD2_9DIPT|nr:hypothetical protein Bhyg_13021 [Pseudolycoriella hygida]
MKFVFFLLLLTPACFSAPLINGALSNVGGLVRKLPDLPAVVASLLKSAEGILRAHPNVSKLSAALTKISAAFAEKRNSPKFLQIRSTWSGGDFSKIGDNLKNMGKVIQQTQDSAGDLDLLNLSDLDDQIALATASIINLRDNIIQGSSGGSVANGSVTLETGVSMLATDINYLSEVIRNVQGPGAIVFALVLHLSGLPAALGKTCAEFRGMGEVDSEYAWRQVAEAVSALIDAIMNLLNLVIN